jgi:hypothetical protein
MALWFLRGLRRGVVTTRYPARLDRWTATLPTPPEFRPGLLTETLADRLTALCPSREAGTLIFEIPAPARPASRKFDYSPPHTMTCTDSGCSSPRHLGTPTCSW